MKGQTVEQLKKGTTLTVAVKNQANAEVTFVLPLSGFGKAFDGPAVDPKVLEQQQQQQQALQDEMQKRADAERQRLESAPAAPAAAPAAPATWRCRHPRPLIRDLQPAPPVREQREGRLERSDKVHDHRVDWSSPSFAQSSSL